MCLGGLLVTSGSFNVSLKLHKTTVASEPNPSLPLERIMIFYHPFYSSDKHHQTEVSLPGFEAESQSLHSICNCRKQVETFHLIIIRDQY